MIGFWWLSREETILIPIQGIVSRQELGWLEEHWTLVAVFPLS